MEKNEILSLWRASGLTLAEFCRRCRISKRAFNYWMNDRCAPSSPIVARLRAFAAGGFAEIEVESVSELDFREETREVRTLIKSTGLSATKFAEFVGVSPTTAFQWANGKRIPTPGQLQFIAWCVANGGPGDRRFPFQVEISWRDRLTREDVSMIRGPLADLPPGVIARKFGVRAADVVEIRGRSA